MQEKFHDRFNIPIDLVEARRRFVNRIHNVVFNEFLLHLVDENLRFILSRAIATALGDRHEGHLAHNFVGDDFLRNLAAVEGLYRALSPLTFHAHQQQLDFLIAQILKDSEIDVGVVWNAGRFIKTGARLLDERTVNDVLDWLRQDGVESVYVPFEKGLEHLLHSTSNARLLPDVITDMYEALEALAKILTKRDKDLSANREAFVKQVKASDGYKKLLSEYITYANGFRHALGSGERRNEPTPKEVESFVYLTGLFIRLAMP